MNINIHPKISAMSKHAQEKKRLPFSEDLQKNEKKIVRFKIYIFYWTVSKLYLKNRDKKVGDNLTSVSHTKLTGCNVVFNGLNKP